MRNLIIGFSLGITVSAATAQVYSHVDTNGVLQDYIVQKDGKDICRDPEVWIKFRGPESYIVCP